MKEDHLNPYQQYLEELTKTFNKIEYNIIPRAQNQFIDALATLASMVKIPKGVWTQPLEIKQSYQLVHEEKEELTTLAIEKGVPWSYDIMKFLELRIYLNSADKKGRHLVRMMVM